MTLAANLQYFIFSENVILFIWVPSLMLQARQEAIQTLCSAPPSDILNCESWSNLRKHLAAALLDPDSNFSVRKLLVFTILNASFDLNLHTVYLLVMILQRYCMFIGYN